MNLRECFSYEIKERTTLLEIQQLLENDTNIKVNNQELILPRGTLADPNKPATQLWAPPVSIHLLSFSNPTLGKMIWVSQEYNCRKNPLHQHMNFFFFAVTHLIFYGIIITP